jgi:hypothetical protein
MKGGSYKVMKMRTKKYLSVMLALCLVCVFMTGCAEKNPADSDTPALQHNTTQSYIDSLQRLIEEKITDVPETAEKAETPPIAGIPEETSKSSGGVDVDLTDLSSTMVFAEVSNIMYFPEEYIGKTVKINGLYNSWYFEPTDTYYSHVIIEDALACCSSGLEFTLGENYAFPEDYPQNDTRIEITGVFDSYDELGLTYYHIKADSMTVVG